MRKEYRGQRRDDAVIVTVNSQPLNPRHDLRNHSPDGFNWGYGGSGPAQLALAILADHLGNDQLALANYQVFKSEIIAGLQDDQWTLTSDAVAHAMQEIFNRDLPSPG